MGKPLKVLVIRFSSIGDIVLTTPVVRALKQQLGAEVHFVTKRAFRQIVDPNPYINKVFALEKKIGDLLPQLRQEGYDAVIDLHNNLRSRQIRFGLRGVRTYGFNKLNLEKWLLVNFQIDRLPRVHIVDRYMAAAAALGVKPDGEGLDYFIPPEEEIDHASFLSAHLPAKQLSTDGAYIALVVGAAHATKRLPPDRLIELCRGMAMCPIVLLGGPEDAEIGRQVAQESGPHVVNACGTLRLHQSASLVRQARLVVTNDTGLMHIAAAFRKEIVSLWGNTVPEFGMYPYYPAGINHNHSLEVKGLFCRPCSKIGFQACPLDHFDCMRELPLELAVELAEQKCREK